VIKIFSILSLLILIFIQNIKSQELDIYTAEEPPMSFEKNGTVVGFSTEIVEEIMARMNSTDTIQLVPWARAYTSVLSKKNVATYSMGRTDLREALFHWVGPIVKKRWVFYSLKKRGIEINRLVDAKGLTVGVVRNDARSTFLKSNGLSNIYEVNDHHIALNMLKKGRIDLWASSDFEGPSIIKESGYELSDFDITYTIKTIESYIAISKNTPVEIVGKWKNAFFDLKNDGSLNRIADKWRSLSGLDITGENGVIAIQNN